MKNFALKKRTRGPNLHLMFKLHEIRSMVLRKIIKIVAPDVDFKAKMHQILNRLGLSPRPRWGSLQRSPDPLAGFKGPTSKGRGGEGTGGERKGEGRGGKEGKGGGRGPISSAVPRPPKHVKTALD